MKLVNEKGKNTKSLIITLTLIVTVILVTSTTIGYSALNTRLNVSGEASVNLTKEWTYNYTGAAQTFEVPFTGVYWIRLWGAGARGAGGTLVDAKIYLDVGEKLYIYIGEYGEGALDRKTFNGGGASGLHGVAGGGATDVRLVPGNSPTDWSDFVSLKSRIMVAAGAGGKDGGNASDGGDLYGTIPWNKGYDKYGTAATQKVAGTSAQFGQWWPASPLANGSFGIGADDVDGTTSWVDFGGSGGGGYFGGAAIAKGGNGGGGSTFISGFAGSNAITSAGNTPDTLILSNTPKHYSGKYFLGPIMKGGVNFYPGKATISYVGKKLYKWKSYGKQIRYIRSCMNGNTVDDYAKWSEFQVIKDGNNIAKGKTVISTFPTSSASEIKLSNITDGDIDTYGSAYDSYTGNQCITLDLGSIMDVDEMGIWGYFQDRRTTHNNTFSTSKDNSEWTILHDKDIEEKPLGTHYQDY